MFRLTGEGLHMANEAPSQLNGTTNKGKPDIEAVDLTKKIHF